MYLEVESKSFHPVEGALRLGVVHRSTLVQRVRHQRRARSESRR